MGLALLTIAVLVLFIVQELKYKKLNDEVLGALGLEKWLYNSAYDAYVEMKSSKAVSNYTYIQYFKDNRENLNRVYNVLEQKQHYKNLLLGFLQGNEFEKRFMYSKVKKGIRENLKHLDTYVVVVHYSSPTGKSTNQRVIVINGDMVVSLINDPSPIMTKSEYNQMIKQQNKDRLDQKHQEFYGRVNRIIDIANNYREGLIVKSDQDELDKLMATLFDRTVNSIKKIKDIDSEEWGMLNSFIMSIENSVGEVINRNQQIINYYNSDAFKQIKNTCDSLMESQREFNNYINEKAQSISKLFGTRVARNETVIEDEYNYIRPYKKSITPFTAEVSANVFASAENNPLDYVVKYFYPNKEQYPEQIQKLQLLVEELETLKEAKHIIDEYKKDYQQYISGVPSFILENDEDGFYSRLGFANISESTLTVEYKFSYTSGGGMAKRQFSVPMTEETIIELAGRLQSKLSLASFAKEQRALMTSRLRQKIKERDNYTCKVCGNSIHVEPNLLLEIDHIIPVSKGGATVEENLQTLCWRCNRTKGDKLI